MKKKNKNSIVKKCKNKKIYIIFFTVCIILLVIYFMSWYKVKKEERLMNSYLINTSTIESSISDIDSIDQVLQEAPSSYFIFISYHFNEETYKIEKQLKSIIDKYKINDIFYYIDITNIKDNSNYIKNINKELNTNISEVPVLLYINNGFIEEKNILYKSKINSKEIEKILKNYNYSVFE